MEIECISCGRRYEFPSNKGRINTTSEHFIILLTFYQVKADSIRKISRILKILR